MVLCQLAYLGLVDLDFGSSANWHDLVGELGKMAGHQFQSQPNPSLRADESPSSSEMFSHLAAQFAVFLICHQEKDEEQREQRPDGHAGAADALRHQCRQQEGQVDARDSRGVGGALALARPGVQDDGRLLCHRVRLSLQRHDKKSLFSSILCRSLIYRKSKDLEINALSEFELAFKTNWNKW